MKRKDENLEKNVGLLVKVTNDSDKPTDKFTEDLIAEALNKLKPQRTTKWVKVAAAAAVIIIAIGLFVHYKRPPAETDSHIISQAQKSPAELLTAMSLNMAYRQGGMEAVEKQCEQALKKLGPRPERISVQQILTELADNEKPERTKL